MGTHPTAGEGFALKLALPPAPAEPEGRHRAAFAGRWSSTAILASATVAMVASARAAAAEAGEGAEVFLPPVAVARGGRP